MAIGERTQSIIVALKEGERPSVVAAQFGVSRQYVYQIRQRFNTNPKQQKIASIKRCAWCDKTWIGYECGKHRIKYCSNECRRQRVNWYHAQYNKRRSVVDSAFRSRRNEYYRRYYAKKHKDVV